ncbi:hypothetical protein AM588_10009820 [Phytophthora nicotianae]|uniref:Transmembrane protein n=1 Tax=Phytophthora nicotianae TaxID=4792 RepID=A0A0W8DD15_PHYNI|nr:hypothetical protein AM588_10009820 [Phytophthora nicotianae]
MNTTPRKKIDLLAPAPAPPPTFTYSPRKENEWYLNTQSPHEFQGGALRDGGEVNIWSRDYIGLIAQYAAVGMIFGTLPGTVYPFLFNYLNMEGTQVVSAVVLLNMPWSFKIFYGMITDCVPIMGYRRRPFMVMGWTLCFAMLLVMACMDAGDPFYPDNKYATMEKEELTPEIIATFNESAHHVGGKFIVLMMIAAIGYVGADVAADAMMVEVAQREPEATRGYTQTTIYMMRPMYQVIAYKFLSGIFENFTITCADPMQSYWAEATPLNQKVMAIIGNGIFAIALYFTGRYGLQWNWRSMHAITIVAVTVMDFIVTMLTTWNIFRNQWFWLGVPVVENLPHGISFVIGTYVIVELAGEGNEGAVYGLVGSIANIAIPLASTLSKNVDSGFDVANADIVEDSSHVRWEVTYVLIIRYAMNLFGLVFLPLLPRQKAETQQLKQNGGSSRLMGVITAVYFAFSLCWTVMVNIMSIYPSTSCLVIAGGTGCD